MTKFKSFIITCALATATNLLTTAIPATAFKIKLVNCNNNIFHLTSSNPALTDPKSASKSLSSPVNPDFIAFPHIPSSLEFTSCTFNLSTRHAGASGTTEFITIFHIEGENLLSFRKIKAEIDDFYNTFEIQVQADSRYDVKVIDLTNCTEGREGTELALNEGRYTCESDSTNGTAKLLIFDQNSSQVGYAIIKLSESQRFTPRWMEESHSYIAPSLYTTI
ncbi:MAG: hypothetical protein LBJ95_04560 [Oscillospiraceae bacterium]|nr:hypothetical protein [Oscillospiraceae bacterium]